MSDKQRFNFSIRPEERAVLKQLAETSDRSEAATLRYLIRTAGQVFNVQDQHPQSQPVQEKPQTGQ